MEDAYRFALLVWLSGEYSRLGWTMQLHIGAERNMNTQMVDKLGPDTGYDGIGDECIAHKLTVLMQAMMAGRGPAAPKTLLFTLNDKDDYHPRRAGRRDAAPRACPRWSIRDPRGGITIRRSAWKST